MFGGDISRDWDKCIDMCQDAETDVMQNESGHFSEQNISRLW